MSGLVPVPEEIVKHSGRAVVGNEADNDDIEYEEDDDNDDVRSLLSEIASTRVKKFAERFLKGFGSGLGVYTGVKTVTTLMRNPFVTR